MGWLTWEQSEKKNNSEIKKEMKQAFRCTNKETGETYYSTKDISIKNNVVYVLRNDDTVSVVLLVNNNKEFGYKDMHESAYPYYFDCPKKFISNLEIGNKDWRIACLTHQNEKTEKIKLKFGDIIEFEKELKFSDNISATKFKVCTTKKHTFFRLNDTNSATEIVKISPRTLKNNVFRLVKGV